MAQFSVKIMRLTGSVLGENQHMDLAKSPDRIITLYVAHISTRVGYTVGFNVTPSAGDLPNPDLGVGTSKAWDAMSALHANTVGDPDSVLQLDPKAQRQLLAFNMLQCLTPRHPLAKTVTTETVRAVWTPDADFLRSYNRDQLLAMAKDLHEGDYSAQKKAGLAELVADLAKKHKAWLPAGFSQS